MSFILDALKKSETERQQQGNAEFASVPVGKARARTPRWIWVIAALLVINVAAMLGLFLRPDAPPVGGVSASQAITPEVTAAAEPDLPEAADSFADRIAVVRDTQPDVAVVTEPAPTSPAVEQQAAPPLPAPVAAGAVTTDVPSLVELQTSGRVQVAPLHLDIHVFSYVPSERFVFINMNKATEGTVLDEGPRVEEITVDGVVLRYQGETFKLTRE